MLFDEQKLKLQNNTLDVEKLKASLEYEDALRQYAFRCWEYEFCNGGKYISWFKNDVLKDMPQVISSTFSREISDTFCDMRYGISYEVLADGFLGACNKDAATIICDSSQQSIYTIGELPDGRIVNSYNMATPIITPVQVFDKSTNTYQSKHNEIILDSRFIKPISAVYLDEADFDMVNQISVKYGIPIQKVQKSKEL